MKNKAKMIILTIAVILWMAFIFSMSAKNATQSSNISGGFTYNVLNTFFSKFRNIDTSTQDSIVEGLQFIVRKGAHFFAYAILAGLCFVDLTTLEKINKKKCFIVAMIISVIYATSDEIHQYFVPGRACQFRDIIIDSCGAIFGIAVIIFLNIIIDKVKTIYNRKAQKN